MLVDIRGGSEHAMGAVPEFLNNQAILKAAEVRRFVAEDESQFNDVRYPGEFARGHLPGAINIPIRALPSDTLRAKIAKLEHQPIIAACYDRRGCFMAQVPGCELTRAGYGFRGRYTVPWEYFEPKPLKPRIALWLAEQNRGIWVRATDLGANKLAVVDPN